MAGHPLFAALYDRLTARAEQAGLADVRASVLAAAAGRTLERAAPPLVRPAIRGAATPRGG